MYFWSSSKVSASRWASSLVWQLVLSTRTMGQEPPIFGGYIATCIDQSVDEYYRGLSRFQRNRRPHLRRQLTARKFLSELCWCPFSLGGEGGGGAFRVNITHYVGLLRVSRSCLILCLLTRYLSACIASRRSRRHLLQQTVVHS